jgi:Flp pilus assembly protein TadG
MRPSNVQRGFVMILTILMMVALTMLVSLAVDFGRVEVTKTELQRAADSAARYGASGLANIINGESAAAAQAVAAAADNTADGTPVVLNPTTDVQLIIWNPATATYTVTSDPTQANAVRVTAERTKANGNAVQMTFAKILGFKSCDVNVSAIAMLTSGPSVTDTVPATGNPFLAGMPAGSKASVGNPSGNYDVAGTTSNPLQSPTQVNLSFTPGRPISFDGVNGGANNQSSPNVFNADGNIYDVESNYTGNDNNMGNMNAPLNSLVGIFLNNSVPTSTATPNPSMVDYSTDSVRDFQSSSPPLKQIFFIGDGRTDDGLVQQFIPPTGATRLFLATWDGWHWGNNIGSFSVTVHTSGTVSLVK